MAESTEDYGEQVESIRELLAARDGDALSRAVHDMRPYDVPYMLDGLEAEEKTGLFEALSADAAARLLGAADEESMREIVSGADVERLIKILGEMPLDAAADVLRVLGGRAASRLLSGMARERAAEIERLLGYAQGSAGDVMRTDVIRLNQEMTLAEAVRQIREMGRSEHIRYPYVVDDNGVLVGIVPLYRLVFRPFDTKVRDVMETSVISVSAGANQQELGNLVRRYHLYSFPVVDEEKKLIGMVTIGNAVRAMEDKASKDMYRIVGTGERDPLRGSLRMKIWLRLPWVAITLAGGLIICHIVRMFRGSITEAVALASFLPMIPLVSGTVALQASTIVVRGLALGSIGRGKTLRMILRELAVAVVFGIVWGVVVAITAGLLYGKIALAGVVAAAVTATAIVAVIVGTIMPLIFNGMGIDPALAAGPLVTALSGVAGVSLYLALANSLLQSLK